MKSYDTESRDEMAAQPSQEEGADVQTHQANGKDTERASDVAAPEVSMTEVVDGEVADEELSDKTIADEEEEDKNGGIHTLVRLGSGTAHEDVMEDEDEANEDNEEDEQPHRPIFSLPTRSQV
ncbi:MAG: hypothetical protein H0V70_23100, partial [Ktedonobacteraceae bacterium]|nr:hypothetical protein [Ktedonobacteraceae bacterium]